MASSVVLITMVGPRNVLSNEDGTAVIPAAQGLDQFIRNNLSAFGGLIHTALEWDSLGEDVTMVYRAPGVPIAAIHHVIVGLLTAADGH